jgi:hypothetical protein
MAFGQPAGPPASHTQIRHLLSLIEEAGHSGFRDARGPLRLTQRQAGGKFTQAEADTLIEQLEAVGLDDEEPDERAAPPPVGRRTARAPATPVRSLQAVEAALLATELERRGWVVIPPPSPTT